VEELNEIVENPLALPCPSCGSQLHYVADNQKLSCEYCGYKEEINHCNDEVIEQNLSEAVALAQDFSPTDVGKKMLNCDNCGAHTLIESDDVKATCSFCGSNKVNTDAYHDKYIQPIGIVPFYISKVAAIKLFDKWIKQGWFHPSKLKKLASIGALRGIYLPFWTFDSKTSSQWSGEAGNHYSETIRVNVNGQMQTQTVQRTRWTHRSGKLDHFFDDVLVEASGGLEQKHLNRILPFRLEEVVNFDPRLVFGWEAEVYNLEVHDGYKVADKIMDHRLRNMCSAQLGGDVQRNLHVNSEKWGQTFKHIVLPIWICVYDYRGKTFHFTINGQTGRVYGKKPISWIKIGLLILLFVLLVFGIWYLRQWKQGLL